MGQTHLPVGNPKVQAEEGYGPSPINIKHKIALGYSRGQFSPQQNPKSHRTEGQKRYRTKLERKSKNIKGKLPLLPFNTLHLTEPHSLTFTTTSNDFEYGLMGQVSILESLNLHVDEGQWMQVGIKGKVSNL